MPLAEPDATPQKSVVAVQAAEPPARDAPGHDCRLGVTFAGRTYFLHVRFGIERRSPERLEVDGQVPLPVAATASLTTAFVLFGLFGVFCFLYLLKSMAGIDVFGGASPLHPLYALIFE